MKKGNVVMWALLAGSIVLFAVLSLVAQNDARVESSPPVSNLESPATSSGEKAESSIPPAGLPEGASITTVKESWVVAGTATTTVTDVQILSATGTVTAVVPINVTRMVASDMASTVISNPEPDMLPPEDGASGSTNLPSVDLVSMALDDVPLLEVVKMFTKIANANIIATATNLRGNVTVNIQDVEWKPALDSILSMHGMTLIETSPGSRIYTVGPIEVGRVEPLVVSTRMLKFASASNVVILITPLLDAAAKENITAFNSRNTVVVRATEAKVLDIEKVIKSIDIPRQQVYIEAKFVELSDSAIKSLGVDWQSLDAFGMNLNKVSWGQSQTRDTVKSSKNTALQTEGRYKTDAIGQNYDSYGSLVDNSTIGGTITGDRNIGLNSGQNVSDIISKKTEASTEASVLKTTTIKDVRTAVLDVDEFKVVISALEKTLGASIVSNPKIIVANEEPATIQIGKKEPNIKGTVTAGQQGQANTTTYALDEKTPYFDYGVTVEVVPTINDASNITVKITPTLSRFLENKTSPDGNTYPITSTKTIKTIFSLESGKTAAIGGLTEIAENTSTKKVPLLGDIPLIGKYLFQWDQKSKARTETIIFVTVGLANPENMTKEIGLPEDSDLINTHLLRRTYTRKDSDAKLVELKIAIEKEQQEKAKKAKKESTPSTK